VSDFSNNIPSVFSRRWLGGRKGVRPVKTEWWGVGMVICLQQGADLHMAQLMPLPLTVSRPGHSKFFFSGQENCKISGHFSGHQNHVFKLK